MVFGVPSVNVSSTNGFVQSLPANDQMFGTVIECTKGEPNKIALIESATQLYQEFKIKMNAYWGVGGQALYVVRAATSSTNGASAPTKSTQTFLDTATTPTQALTLTAKQPGSYEIYVTISANGSGGTNIILEEDGYSSEYYIGITGIEKLANRINNESNIVDATFKAEGSGTLTSVTREILGATGTRGTDGLTVTSDPAWAGQIPAQYATIAHENALALLQDYTIAGVFCTQVTSDTADAVHAVYVEHVQKMNTSQYHGWRFAIIGAPDKATKGEIITEASSYNNENVAYVGQGVIDTNGTNYSPTEATQIIAGKMGATDYYNTIWGGQSEKILGTNNTAYIVDTIAVPGTGTNGTPTYEDYVEYNEAGAITFTTDSDGVKIKEAITTAHNYNSDQEDELAVVRIVRHAKYVVYNTCLSYLGLGITDTFKTDLQEAIKTALEEMKIEGALTDDTDNNYSAYSASVSIVPYTSMIQGKVTANVSITPVHAARTINASITVY